MKLQVAETTLAAAVVAWLEDQDWDVYQEVQCHAGRADIVAVRRRISWIIEVKTRASLEVIWQAAYHRGAANYLSIAAPHRRNPGPLAEIAEWKGIGWLDVSAGDYGEAPTVRETIAAPLHRRLVHDVRELLRPEHKTHAPAGTSGGGYWSPFKATCREVLTYVSLRPGCSVKDLVAGIKTHYRSSSSARAAIPYWVEAGKVPGVRLERDGRAVRLFPTEAR